MSELELQIGTQASELKTGENFELNVILKNDGKGDATGFTPTLGILWFNFDEPWHPDSRRKRKSGQMSRSPKQLLPADFAHISRGKMCEVALETTAPSQPGLYFLMSYFNLFRESSKSQLTASAHSGNVITLKVN